VHEDGGINARDVFMELHHGLPPIFADVVLEQRAVLPVIVHGTEPVINFGRLKNEPVLFGVGDNVFEKVFGISHAGKAKLI
jgi:hypothetical protein